MLAVKNRRSSEYVLQAPAPKSVIVVALANGSAIGVVPSPARLLQADLAARLAGDAAMVTVRSARWRAGMVCGAALLAWMPLVLAASLIFA